MQANLSPHRAQGWLVENESFHSRQEAFRHLCHCIQPHLNYPTRGNIYRGGGVMPCLRVWGLGVNNTVLKLCPCCSLPFFSWASYIYFLILFLHLHLLQKTMMRLKWNKAHKRFGTVGGKWHILPIIIIIIIISRNSFQGRGGSGKKTCRSYPKKENWVACVLKCNPADCHDISIWLRL